MFIQVKALPLSDRPYELEKDLDLYVSANTDGYVYSEAAKFEVKQASKYFFTHTLDEIIQHEGWGQVVVTAEHSHQLVKSHTSQVSYWGYDGLVYCHHMVPRSNPGKFPIPKWEELIHPTA